MNTPMAHRLRSIGAAGLLMLLFATSSPGQSVPEYRVDPFWPARLPNNWSMQQIVDISIGPNDHVWAINRHVDARPDETGRSQGENRQLCCTLGPEILEFDPEGNVVRAWGGPDHHPGWPNRLQTLTVDSEGNVWISGTRPGTGGRVSIPRP
jgi:hypothetical protein